MGLQCRGDGGEAATLFPSHPTPSSFWSPHTQQPCAHLSTTSALSPNRDLNATHSLMLFPVLLQLHTTQRSQVFPLSLQLKGQPARFLDSPDPMTGGSPHPLHMATGNSATMGGAQPGGTDSGAQCMAMDVPPWHSLSTQALRPQHCLWVPGHSLRNDFLSNGPGPGVSKPAAVRLQAICHLPFLSLIATVGNKGTGPFAEGLGGICRGDARRALPQCRGHSQHP